MIDLADLDEGVSGLSGYLYEAQTSFIITGLRNWLWTAYCFAENFFDPELKGGSYLRDVGPESRSDAFRNGSLIAADQFRDPRQYFLVLLRAHMEHVNREWGRVVGIFRDSARRLDQVSPSSFLGLSRS